MFCFFPNIFSQSYIVRLFRFAIILINIYIEFRVSVEILNVANLSCSSITLF